MLLDLDRMLRRVKTANLAAGAVYGARQFTRKTAGPVISGTPLHVDASA
jgi:hypothetical protein